MKKFKIKLNSALLFLTFIFLLGSFFFLRSSTEFVNANYKVKFFPLALSLLLIVLCVAEFFRSNISESNKEVVEKTKPKKDDELESPLVAFMWLAFIPIVTYLIGFYASLPLFTFLFLKFKKIKTKIAIIITACIFCIVLFGFGMVLRMQLYKGLIFRFL